MFVGFIVHITILLEFPHKLDCKILVSLESLKFTYDCLSLIHLITLLNAKILLLIFYPYFLVFP